ncbi:hypothetical protein DEU56DRAFT_833572 [Suillus clintonianus]|uniref:uncharacterized protein n=1 Tax=Suillus clintonianus TaxID=1904413 RepID=UPI001B881EBE|nr:uncharacterized protein DEU56DRAFT_833572 [Suillus clintonianus]KAG2121889.1 hypothetical protein DEU56DRAFT_833572 [Suillus clintonianus]
MTDYDMDYESSSSSRDPSPSSSPLLAPIDSSPPSSPHFEPYVLDSPPPTRLSFSHPFAASAKANKRPPQREKKADTPPSTPPASAPTPLSRSSVYSRSLGEKDYMHDDASSLFSLDSTPHRTSHYFDRDERLWDDALRKPFDTGNGHIDLSNLALKIIPASIADLAGFFNTTELSEQSLFSGRGMSRVKTEPAFESRVRSFERTKSIVDSGKERHMLQLYLFGNSIHDLPPELFKLENLTVLSLRGNLLTYIPPEICHLINLKELNISLNRLSYLPSEMRDMKLLKLQLNPNPFLSEPSFSRVPSASRNILSRRRSMARTFSQRGEAEANPSRTITVSPSRTTTVSPLTTFLSPVPPLTEICYRNLLCPLQGDSSRTVLSEYYGVPLPDVWNVPENVRAVLTENVPGIFKSAGFPPEPRKHGRRSSQGAGGCANPEHKGRFFVRHAAERFTWERRVAGVDVGGAVPLRWRGCMQSCLRFLDEDARQVNAVELPPTDASDAMDFDEAEAVMAVDLGGGALSMDEFDD